MAITIGTHALLAGETPPAVFPVRMPVGLNAPLWAPGDFAIEGPLTVGGHAITLTAQGRMMLQLANPTRDLSDATYTPGRLVVMPEAVARTITVTRTITFVGAGALTPPAVVQRVSVQVLAGKVGEDRVMGYAPAADFPALISPAVAGFVPDRDVAAIALTPGFTRPVHRFVTVTYLPRVLAYTLYPMDAAGAVLADGHTVLGLAGQPITQYPAYLGYERQVEAQRVPDAPETPVFVTYTPVQSTWVGVPPAAAKPVPPKPAPVQPPKASLKTVLRQLLRWRFNAKP
ncbi:hypothetical protein [Lacticaseibacillus daqingensis]|uniref:hypothetical protein n=1 Tax=Lacticaseibacillus daqingensis TaxID=2486014 RepID=UPI000F7A2FB1|nr:hypothetical protein [Lacticaseibacillus daqingensis]